jgi:TonB family protein
MRVCGILLVAALLVPQSAVAKDSAPLSLGRIGKWEAHYEPDACHLAARFGTGAQELIVRLTRFEPSDSFELAMFGEPVKQVGVDAQVKIDFGLAAQPDEVRVMLGTSGKRPMMLFGGMRFDAFRWPDKSKDPVIAPTISPEQEARITRAVLRINSRRIYRIETGSMAKPMESMRTCLTNLVSYWGFDPVVQQGLTRKVTPINSPGTWLNSNDYPRDALANGAQGIVQFRLDVSETGAVSACRVLFKTSPDEFADTTCRNITRRAKLLPALDAAGKPVKSFYINKARFQIP